MTLGRRTLLVVDDDREISDLLAALLATEGWNVSNTSDSREAVRWLQSRPPPDVILTDVMMPDMSGFELVEKIVSLPGVKDVPVIQMSAHYLEKVSPRVNAVIAKPFKLPELLVLLNRLAPLTPASRP